MTLSKRKQPAKKIICHLHRETKLNAEQPSIMRERRIEHSFDELRRMMYV